MHNVQRYLALRMLNYVTTLLVTSALIGCGGGNDNDGIKSYAALTISGTVATVAPIANAPLTFKCQSETGTRIYTYFDTTDVNGAYSKRVDAASAPCVISVEYTDNNGTSQTLSSYAKQLSTSTVANITPLTHAVLSSMMGATISTYTVSSDNDVLNKLKTTLEQNNDQTVWNLLNQNLIARGLDTSAITDHPVSDYFNADSGHLGQGYDKLLDDLILNNLEAAQLYQLAGGINRFQAVASTNDAEVIDIVTGLVWQRCVVGKVWNGTTCSGTETRLYWSEMPQTLTNMPLSTAADAKPWRLPTYSELATLHDGSATTAPYVADKTWFPATTPYWTWSSTAPLTPGSFAVARIIGFQRRSIGTFAGETTDQLVVRLVR